jgi:hypothetical protein
LKSDGIFYLKYESGQFGLALDVPVAEDFDGDGKTDIAVWRPSTGMWYIQQSSNGQVRIEQFGKDGDKAQAADYDGDGRADLAVYRPTEGMWYVAKPDGVPAQNFHAIPWGVATDLPMTFFNTPR